MNRIDNRTTLMTPPATPAARITGVQAHGALLLALAGLLSGCTDSGDPAAVPAAVTLEILAGDGQLAYAGAPLRDSLTVRVLDAQGRPVAGAGVHFDARDGGSIAPASAKTGVTGTVMAVWRLGPDPGENRAEIRLEGNSAAPLAVSARGIKDFRIDKQGEALVQELSARLAQATSTAARESAILAVLRALNVGVYTARGDIVVPGAERSSTDFFLYDFEIGILARALARQETWTLADIAATVTQMGFGTVERPVTPDELLAVLQDGTRAALASSADPASLGPLMVRDAGLLRPTPYDLAASELVQEPLFDPLQATLITMDFAIAILSRTGPPVIPSQLASIMPGIVRNVSRANSVSACTDLRAWLDAQEGDWAAGKWWGGQLIGLVAEYAATVATIALDRLHGGLIHNSIQVTPHQSRTESHYGHGAPAEGLVFQLEVRMLDQLPQLMIDCGFLASVEFPPAGGIEGVRVKWDVASPVLPFLRSGDDPRKHGTFDCNVVLGDCSSLTDRHGMAALTFTPHRELIPALGREETAEGWVFAEAFYWTKLGNVTSPPDLLQRNLKTARFKWAVSYHEPPHLAISIRTEITYEHGDAQLATVGLRAEGNLDRATEPLQTSERLDYFKDQLLITHTQYTLGPPPSPPDCHFGWPEFPCRLPWSVAGTKDGYLTSVRLLVLDDGSIGLFWMPGKPIPEECDRFTEGDVECNSGGFAYWNWMLLRQADNWVGLPVIHLGTTDQFVGGVLTSTLSDNVTLGSPYRYPHTHRTTVELRVRN